MCIKDLKSRVQKIQLFLLLFNVFLFYMIALKSFDLVSTFNIYYYNINLW